MSLPIYRQLQWEQLESFVKKSTAYSVPNLTLVGEPSTGKSHTLSQYLQIKNIKHVWIECEGCLFTRNLMLRIIQQLGVQCNFIDSFDTFIAILNTISVKSYIVLDGISSEDYKQFLYVHEFVQGIRFIYIVKDDSVSPAIFFPRYSESECQDILALSKPGNETWKSFIKLLVESFFAYTGADLEMLKELADAKWRVFTENGVSDVLTMYRQNQKLFANVDSESKLEAGSSSYNLSKISKYIIIAAYLASYLESKFDMAHFSKWKHLKSGRRHYGRRKELKINPRYLNATTFPLERLFAILHAIYDGEVPRSVVLTTVATLHGLKLLASSSNLDILNTKTRWRANVQWEIVLDMSREVGFNIQDFFSA